MTRTDEYGTELGYCDSCGEECDLDDECCEDGEIVTYDEDEDDVERVEA